MDDLLREVVKEFHGRTFEFRHVMRKVPGYTVRIHRKFSREGYICIDHIGSYHARFWRITERGNRIFERDTGRVEECRTGT